jgi:hypothetical protein
MENHFALDNEKMPADNERFGARGAVTTRKRLCEKKHFVPHESLSLRQAATTLGASVESVVEKAFRSEKELHLDRVVEKETDRKYYTVRKFSTPRKYNG